jgi:hypothetical protein
MESGRNEKLLLAGIIKIFSGGFPHAGCGLYWMAMGEKSRLFLFLIHYYYIMRAFK